jgi:hypothetical protein
MAYTITFRGFIMKYIDKILSLLFIIIISVLVPFVVPIVILCNTLQDLFYNVKFAVKATKIMYIRFYKDFLND